MKIFNIKLVTALFAVVLMAGVCIFYACKKEEVIKNTITPQVWKEKIEYMKIPCVDFSRIKKEVVSGTKSTAPMLVFESWEHYASVIDAMLEFSYSYIEKRVQKVRDSIPGIDEDDLSLILHNQGIYQFMPLYSFVKELQFTNSAFEKLRPEEIQWMQEPPTSDRDNPFDEMEMGYIQSALHNSDGDVMIGNEIYNPKNDRTNGAKSCRQKDDIEIRTLNNNVWPTYNYNGKTRELRGFLSSKQDHSYAKTSVYYFCGNTRIVWLCNVEVRVEGKRLTDCDSNSPIRNSFDKSKKVFASVVEQYAWYIIGTYPNYLDPNYYISNNKCYNSIVFGYYYAPGTTTWKIGL